MKRIILAAILGSILGTVLFQTFGRAQPANQTFSVNMCPTGQVDANSNPIVAVCGMSTNPIAVTTVQQAPLAVQSQSCPPNPLTRKTPPLC